MVDTARIEVQKPFCQGCSVCIKKELQDIDEVNNVSLYPKKSLITFNFMKANKLSEVLNVLSEKGERTHKKQLSEFICDCQKRNKMKSKNKHTYYMINDFVWSVIIILVIILNLWNWLK